MQPFFLWMQCLRFILCNFCSFRISFVSSYSVQSSFLCFPSVCGAIVVMRVVVVVQSDGCFATRTRRRL